MIFIEAPQGTPEWYAARCGKITASCFADAVSRVGGLDERQAKYVALRRDGATQGEAMAVAGYKAAPTSDIVRRALAGEDTSSPSDTAKRYAADLAIERISGAPHGEPAKAWVLERGHEMETRARMLYEARTGAFITEAGICLGDEGIFGYSTDGLAGDDGLIEIKSPIDSIKIMEMWRDGDTSEYDHQIQGGLWLTGRKWLDFIMYVPDLAAAGKDLYVKRILRDEEFIDKMVEQLGAFDKMVQAYESIFRAAPKPTTEENMTTTCSDVVRMLEAEYRDPDSTEATAAPAADQFTGTAPEVAATSSAPLTPDVPTYMLTAAEDPATPPTLRLGQISERFGFQVTAAFLSSLGFEPAGRDKNAVLFHDSQFKAIGTAIKAHIDAVMAKF